MISTKRLWTLFIVWFNIGNFSLIFSLTSKSKHFEEKEALSFESPAVDPIFDKPLENKAFVDIDTTNYPRHAIFYNIYVPPDQGDEGITNALRIVKEQLGQVGKSYAASFDSKTSVFYNTIGLRNGVKPEEMQGICQQNNINCTHMEHYEEGFEQVTLQRVHDYCQLHDSHRVIYLHTKGSYHNRPMNDPWRHHMTMAATSEMCLEPKDDTCNLCGLFYYPFWASFMPGNIWTAQCSYINKLLPPKSYEAKQQEIIKEVLLMKVKKIFSFEFFKKRDLDGTNRDLYGLKRFSAEHWVGSHPAIVPCDLSPRVDLAFMWDQKPDLEFSMAPRNDVDANWFGTLPKITDRVLDNDMLRIKEYFFLAGRIFLWHGLYNEVPPDSSWVWKWFPDGARWKQAIAGAGNNTVERLIQVLQQGSFDNGNNDTASFSTDQPLSTTKAVLLSFPGSGSEAVRYMLEKATGKVGSTTSIVDDIVPDPMLSGNNKSSTDGVLVNIQIGTEVEDTEKRKHQRALLHSIPKRIILLRDPFDVVWSRYERSQTGSYNRHILLEDFHPMHFALQAKAWAEEYAEVTEDYLVSYIKYSNVRPLLVKYEDFIGQQAGASIRQLVEFLDDEAKTSLNDTAKNKSPPSLPQSDPNSEHVTKSIAFASPSLIDMIWDTVKEGAQHFGYSQLPTFNASFQAMDSFDMSKGLPKGRYLTYVPSGGKHSDQIMELEIAAHLAKQSGRTLFLPPLLDTAAARSDAIGYCDTTNRVRREVNLTVDDTFSWGDIVDMEDLAERVDVIDAGRGVIPARFSELTLTAFDRCNTKWDLCHFDLDKGCLPDFAAIPSIATNTSTPVAVRAPQCVFRSAQVNVLRFVDLIGTFESESLPPSPRFVQTLAGAPSKSLSSIVRDATPGAHQYNICNGLSNQLLYHSSSIAAAIKKRKDVDIPDYFIVNGAQTSDLNVLPSPKNSIAFGTVFDKEYFLDRIQQLGLHARFVSFGFDTKSSNKNQVACPGVGSLSKADPGIILKILKAFRPSREMQRVIDNVSQAFEKRGIDQGICLHHRDGQDWHDHCDRWENIKGGTYRGNCRGVPDRSFLGSLQDRGLTGSSSVYYCGDHEIPKELIGYDVVSRDDLISLEDRNAVESMGAATAGPMRDLWALVDFFVCNKLEHFIGNSVSTFSAIQIAMRESEAAFWYNSQSIPLASMWNVYQIPIAYTYTELSKEAGKHMLQASIASVQEHMPWNKIHILYHGSNDTVFQSWLMERGVTIHDHDPSWRVQIEEMRKNGDPESSHLFLDAGNYFGTWQRIDIPLKINSEYCLLLDSDTVVVRPFTIADFGLNLTFSIAMSAEADITQHKPVNAGVMLMNIPYMRHTYNKFLDYILQHVDTPEFGGKKQSPSDQGAYLEFYKSTVRFLSRNFNFKPYWKHVGLYKDAFIVHFHAAKPHDYLTSILGKECDTAIKPMCHHAETHPLLCTTIQEFARSSKSVDQVGYCEAAFSNATEATFCNNVMDILVASESRCSNFMSLIQPELDRLNIPRPPTEEVS